MEWGNCPKRYFALITLVKISHARKRIGNRLQRGYFCTFGSMMSFFSFSYYWSTLASANDLRHWLFSFHAMTWDRSLATSSLASKSQSLFIPDSTPEYCLQTSERRSDGLGLALDSTVGIGMKPMMSPNEKADLVFRDYPRAEMRDYRFLHS